MEPQLVDRHVFFSLSVICSGSPALLILFSGLQKAIPDFQSPVESQTSLRAGKPGAFVGCYRVTRFSLKTKPLLRPDTLPVTEAPGGGFCQDFCSLACTAWWGGGQGNPCRWSQAAIQG